MLSSYSAIIPGKQTVAERYIYEPSIVDKVFEIGVVLIKSGSAPRFFSHPRDHIKVSAQDPEGMRPVGVEVLESV